MRNKIVYPKLRWLMSVALLAVIASGCTKKFEEFNTDPYGITTGDLAVDYKDVGEPLRQAQLFIYVGNPAWVYQLQQNLMADVYSGYMMSPSPFNGNVNNTNYGLVDGWNGYPWDYAYPNVMEPTRVVLNKTRGKNADFYAWAKILRVEAMHRVSDIYGPIIYSKYSVINPDGSVDYDSQKDVYYEFFNDLDTAINTLTTLAQSGAPKTFTKFDLAYGGDFSKWVKFANSLRLRLALRIVNVDPDKAQAEGEKALANPIGLMTSKDDNLLIDISPNDHPLNVINNSWGDIRLGAPIGTYLGGYDDPRLSKYALPATDPAVANQYIGIRNGINIDAHDRYGDYSMLVTFDKKVLLMTAAEAYFLKSEAALRGWAGAGDAQTNYEQGITTSFDQYGVSGASGYIADNTSKPKPYVDPKAITPGQNDVPSGSPWLSTITIKWNSAGSFQENLERIITQKWIAMYPEGQEAWSEFRRTGYPKLFPVVVNNSGGTISTTEFIRRINFASSEKGTNGPGVSKAVTLLGGQDNGGTRLWWDKP